MNTNYARKTFSLFSQAYLDRHNQCYKNIIIVNLPPQGPLGKFVVRLNFPLLSDFKQSSECNRIKRCGLALRSLDDEIGGGINCYPLMTVEDVPNLISFLFENGYTVDTRITSMFNDSGLQFNENTEMKLLCFVTYNG